MTTTTPAVRYFVGKLKTTKRGLPYRIFRRWFKQRRILGAVKVEEMWTRDGWKALNPKLYSQVSNLLKSQAAVRFEKKMWEGKK